MENRKLDEKELEQIIGGGFKEWLERELKKVEDYYSNTKDPISPVPAPSIVPVVLPDNE